MSFLNWDTSIIVVSDEELRLRLAVGSVGSRQQAEQASSDQVESLIKWLKPSAALESARLCFNKPTFSNVLFPLNDPHNWLFCFVILHHVRVKHLWAGESKCLFNLPDTKHLHLSRMPRSPNIECVCVCVWVRWGDDRQTSSYSWPEEEGGHVSVAKLSATDWEPRELCCFTWFTGFTAVTFSNNRPASTCMQWARGHTCLRHCTQTLSVSRSMET